MDARTKYDAIRRAITGHHPAGGTYRVECPCCTSSKPGKHPSLNVQASTGLFLCMRCDIRGKLVPPPDPTAAPPPEPTTFVEPPDGYMPIATEPGRSAVCLAPARAYAWKRGIDTATALALSVGAVLEGFYASRLIIPIADPCGLWRGWVGRDWTGRAEKKYLYPRGMNRRELLFNAAALAVETDVPVLVVEGVLDATPYAPDAVAALGSVSEPQMQLLLAAKRPICFVPDGDAHRQGEALSWRMKMEGRRAGSIKLPPKIDPDQCAHTRIRDLARFSLNGWDSVVY